MTFQSCDFKILQTEQALKVTESKKKKTPSNPKFLTQIFPNMGVSILKKTSRYM